MAASVAFQAASIFFFFSNSRASASWPSSAQGGRAIGRAGLGAALETAAALAAAVRRRCVGSALFRQVKLKRQAGRQNGGDAIAVFDGRVLRHGPLGFEQFPVAQHAFAIVNFCALEGLAAGVMNERVLRDANPEAGKARAQAKIIILEIAAAELLVESADALDDRPARKQAKSHHAANFLDLPGMGRGPFRRELGQLVQIAVTGFPDQLRPGHVIGHRPDDADVRMALQRGQHFFQPAFGDDRVVVEQNHALAPRNRQSLIVPGGKTEIALVGDDNDVALLPASERRYSGVPSVEPLSTRINSCGNGVCARMLSRQRRVCSSWLCARMMMDAMGAALCAVGLQM